MATKICYEFDRYSDICGWITEKTPFGICRETPKEVLDVLRDNYQLEEDDLKDLKISKVKLTPRNIFFELGFHGDDEAPDSHLNYYNAFLEMAFGNREDLIRRVNRISVHDLISVIDKSGCFQSKKRKDRR